MNFWARSANFDATFARYVVVDPRVLFELGHHAVDRQRGLSSLTFRISPYPCPKTFHTSESGLGLKIKRFCCC